MTEIGREEMTTILLDVASTIERRLDSAISIRKGVSYREFSLLKTLSAFPEKRATRVDLAREVSLTPSAVTRALKPLEKIGYVVTEKGERDARQSLANLTGAGEELLKDAQNIVDDTLNSMPLNPELGPALAELQDQLQTRRRR
jgi:DNA-binding MarR family transcriptional regulator